MKNLSAAVLIIGNEILSGRTPDVNTQYIATKLSEKGIYLKEARIVSDIEEDISSAVLELSKKYNYVFTTGGIGPTHDDITTESIAKAFGYKTILNQEAYNRLHIYYASKGKEVSDVNIKMAIIPENAPLIDNPISAAPGFIIKNVYVMAGVPHIMKGMFDTILRSLPSLPSINSKTVTFMLPESLLAKNMDSAQKLYPDVNIGSYPFKEGDQYGTHIVFRSNNHEQLEAAFQSFKKEFD